VLDDQIGDTERAGGLVDTGVGEHTTTVESMSADVYRVQVDPNATNNPHSYALQMTGSGNRVLEVGCSVGHVTEHLVAAGNTVVGVEIDPVAAAEAERFAERVHVLDLDFDALSTVEHGVFDVIILGDVLEHLRDPATALDDLVTRLAPNGRVIASIPNVAHIDVRLMLLEGRWDYKTSGLMDPTHLRWFTKSSLRSLLDDAGLVATRLERVRVGPYGTNIDLDENRSRTDAIAFIEADPEAHTLQFVVEAVRSDTRPTAVDVLIGDADFDWRSLNHSRDVIALQADLHRFRDENDQLREHIAALRRNLDAWEQSTIAKVSRPGRAVWGRVRRALRR